MTETHGLLAEYARSGSETAFRELVERYFGLVYSAALRVVEGDAHLAEDVAQAVFTDLARKAKGLPGNVMLGGWLHHRTYNIGAPMMRAQRRRQRREREAAQMNTLQEDPEADLARIAPIVDEAVTQLRAEDRTAIILRFFERRDFRAIGEALGSTEDAARMRVTRALEKLQVLLKHRGVMLSAAALAAALTGEAVSAAPAGLAASVAGVALAGSTAGGIFGPILKFTLMTKLKTCMIGAAVLAGVATSLVLQDEARARMREQDALLRQQTEQLSQLSADQERLSNALARARDSDPSLAELGRLRAEAAALRQKTNDLALLRAQSRRLERGSGQPLATPLQKKEEIIAKTIFERDWLLALRMFASDHNDQFPTNLEQAAGYLPKDYQPDSRVNPGEFELVYHGAGYPTDPEVIVLQQIQPGENLDGRPMKIYGMADGSVQQLGMPCKWTTGGREVSYDSYEAFENDHTGASGP
jgi:RNA polymerase sigma factor (sigma-70 family)